MTGRDCRVGAPSLPMPCPVCGCWLQRQAGREDEGVGPHYATTHPDVPEVPVVVAVP